MAEQESSRDTALNTYLILHLVLALAAPPSCLPTLCLVSKAWHRVATRAQRSSAGRLLHAACGSRPLASATEEALFTGCGGRAGPGAYNARLKTVCVALRSNAALRARALAGALSPRALVALPPVELQTEAERAQHAAAAAALSAASVLPQRPPSEVGLAVCAACGCTRMWRSQVLRAGSTDVNRASEKLVCCDCRREVARDFGALLAAAGAAKRRREEAEEAEQREAAREWGGRGGGAGGGSDGGGGESDGGASRDASSLFL